ncbi:aminoglycoside phosphotransferase family protein [Paenibacillus sp. V4I7]|uniref:aminoglycoside phosphotransferase family protein n=1 Tax=Paenibacillus sp. V4I7 TaxID=3042307 RepID=UPI0027836519|nr:aminoglycoside phosphotransferase family protein [Paenibacillus sp. V4I7]MDQ0900759.1 aminoglycoside phosphotransferase (APT) family kinase protein [Paenibacillus sp. V4I7]
MSQANEIVIDLALVKRLIAAQFPQWADHRIQPVESAGTDNTIYRLGEDMTVRLPRVEWAIAQVEKEHRWLPKLAPLTPLSIPTPLAMGMPAEGYPCRWSVYRWLEGENATIGRIDNPHQAATALGQFVAALQRIDPAGGPAPGPHNSGRGVPLAMRDASVRNAIATLNNMLDTDVATAAWEAALQAPVWQGKAVWLHGDLHPGNLLVEQGRLTAVIDFGTLGVGDPACDLMVAWTLLSAENRDLFRAALTVDDATWARGRGWALSFGLIAFAYYLDTNPVLAAISRRAIDEVLFEHTNGI